jgi:hypothetical protein
MVADLDMVDEIMARCAEDAGMSLLFYKSFESEVLIKKFVKTRSISMS